MFSLPNVCVCVCVLQVNPRFDGCMREWRWLTGEDTSIQETIRSNDNMQCFSTENPGTYYPGTGFALFNITYGGSAVCGIMCVHVSMHLLICMYHLHIYLCVYNHISLPQQSPSL